MHQHTPDMGSNVHGSQFAQNTPSNLDYGTYDMTNSDFVGMPVPDPSQFEDMLIESRDIDASQLLGLDMMSWFDPSFGDMMPMFDQTSMDGSPHVQHQQLRQQQHYPATSQPQR